MATDRGYPGGSVGPKVKRQPGSSATSVVERDDPAALPGSVEEVAGSVLPSVVKIDVRGTTKPQSPITREHIQNSPGFDPKRLKGAIAVSWSG